MPTKLPKKKGFTKAFTKTKLGYLLDKEIGKGEFVWEYKYEPKGTDTGWHPSGHCTPTLYELYTFAASEEVLAEAALDGSAPIDKNAPAHEAPLAKIFQVGHFWHQYLQTICVRAGLCDEEAVERRGLKGWMTNDLRSFEFKKTGPQSGWDYMCDFDPKPYHWVTGSADICPMEIPGQGEYLIDFKTMGSHQFRGNLPHELTVTKWECQLNTYMEFFDIEKAIIVGINKDAPHDFKEFEFHRNQPLIDSLFTKWKLVSECLDEAVAPPEDESWDLPLKGPANV